MNILLTEFTSISPPVIAKHVFPFILRTSREDSTERTQTVKTAVK